MPQAGLLGVESRGEGGRDKGEREGKKKKEEDKTPERKAQGKGG